MKKSRKKRNPNINLEKLGIKPGDKLQFAPASGVFTDVYVTVVDNNNIEYNGEIMSRDKFNKTYNCYQRQGTKTKEQQSTAYFLYNGVRLGLMWRKYCENQESINKSAHDTNSAYNNMLTFKEKVMPTSKGNTVMPANEKGNEFINVIPTKENVDYNRIYLVNDPELLRGFSSLIDDKEYNREIKPKHVKEIKNVILCGEFGGKYIAPIRIDINRGLVIDGNHTFEAYKAAWNKGSKEFIKIIFLDVPEDEIIRRTIIKDINNNQVAWKVQDFATSAMNAGKPSAISLNDFAANHPLCIYHNKLSIRTAGCFLKGENITKDIKGDTLSIAEDELAFGEQIYNEVNTMMEKLEFVKNNWFESFVKAWWHIRKTDKAHNEIIKDCGFDTFIENIVELSKDWQLNSRVSYWEGTFRTAIWTMWQNVTVNKTWKRA